MPRQPDWRGARERLLKRMKQQHEVLTGGQPTDKDQSRMEERASRIAEQTVRQKGSGGKP